MYDDGHDVDLSIQLVPVDGTLGRQAPRRRVVHHLLVACAILLSLSVVWLLATKLRSILESRNAPATAAAQRDFATERAEAVKAFGSFDAAAEREMQLSPSERQERDAIAALFDQLQEYAAAQDDVGFARLVDFDRLLKRIELTGNLRGWNSLEKRFVRTELKESAGVKSFWSKILVVGAVPSEDDPNSRIVYAYSWAEAPDTQTENRFWIARDGDTWKIYDWERLDLGISQSVEWSLYCKYFETPAMKGYQRWAELVAASDKLAAEGDNDAAMENLRLAESESVPREFGDYCCVLTGYRWFSLGEADEMERCSAKVKRPDETPGLYYSLMNHHRWSQPDEALKFAELYEAAVGTSPAVLEAKGRLLATMNRKEEAVDEWKKLLQIQPDNSSALTELYLALPEDDKSAFEAQLASLENPAPAVVQIATSIGYRDFPGLLYLEEYLEREAPGTAGAWFVKGVAAYLDGRYREAAEAYRHAFESETDEAKRDSYVTAYVDAMTADGRVVAALENVPDAKSAFESLFYSYDETDVALTDEEYGRLVGLYVARFPDSLDAMQRQAALAVEQKRFEEAERLLRHALEQVAALAPDDADDQDTEYDDNQFYRDSFANSLASVLWKLGRRKEAYERVGEPRKRFQQFARQAIADRRWEDARRLVELHSAKDPQDPEIHYIQGELAAHEMRWDDAIGHYQQALALVPKDENWHVQNGLEKAYIDSGNWKGYYDSHENPAEAFDSLARRFTDDMNWDALSELISAHQIRSRHDLKVTKHAAELAWERQEYATYAPLANQLLQSNDEDVVSMFGRDHMENRRLSALLRSGKKKEALELALAKQRKENDVTALAIVHAATGNLAEASRFAHEAAAADESGLNLYTHEDAGLVFLSDRFRNLHREFPVELPYETAPTLAVFLLDGPQPLEPADIEAALQQLGIQTTAVAQPLKSMGESNIRAFALRFDRASIWLATEAGKFDDGWKLDDQDQPLAGLVNQSQAWLAVGTAAWTDSDRKQVAPLARRLSGQLAQGHASVICARDHNLWNTFTAYPVTPDLIHLWQSSGNLSSLKDRGITLESIGQDANVAADRQFDRSLHEAVRAFEARPDAKLEVWASLSDDPAIGLLPLDVTEVQRTFGSLKFDGTLQSDSLLIPQLRAGLPMRYYKYKVRAWRLNDEPLVYRP